jgi:hypothetical protein
MFKMRSHRSKTYWFLVGILGLPVLAVSAWIYSVHLIDAAVTYRSPLQASPPLPGNPLGSPLTQRVVIFLVDALRDDTSRDAHVMPFLNEIRQQGASATMHSQPPSFSIPGWITILSGAWPDINDSQVFNPPAVDQVRMTTQDNVFSASHRAGLHSAISGYPWFKFLFPPEIINARFFPTSGEMILADRAVADAALPWIDSGDYQLILIHFDQVDDAGHHQGGPLSANWAAASTRVDTILRDTVHRLDLERDTVIVISDHGQIDRGGLGAHGGAEPAMLIEPFIMTGAGVQPGMFQDIKMVDVAPTIAVLLGINIPAANEGQPLFAMLSLKAGRQEEIHSALATQQQRLLQTYSAAINEPATFISDADVVAGTQAAIHGARLKRLWRERLWSIPLAFILGLAPGIILWRRHEKKAIWLALFSLLTILLFYVRVVLLDRDGYNYFISTPPWRIELYLFVAVTMGVALMIGWAACLIRFRAFQFGPKQAAGMALAYFWMTAYLLGIVVAINFAVNGVLFRWTLPEFWTMFLALLAFIQMFFVAIFGMLLVSISAGIAVLVGKRNRTRPIPVL